MIIEFEENYLKYLYEEGKTPNYKKYPFQPQLINQYIKTVNRLELAEKIEDLFAIGSLNYETLKGDKKGYESVRVNQQYRIEFKSHTEGAPPNVITICRIFDLNNHYEK